MQVIRAIFVWALTVTFLYVVNWHGWPVIGTDQPVVSDELRLGLCAVAAILVVFVVSFVWQLFVQPVQMHREAHERIAELSGTLARVFDAEEDRRWLIAKREEGMRLYRAPLDWRDATALEQWRSRMKIWLDEVMAHLEEGWSVSALMDFKEFETIGSRCYRRSDNYEDDVSFDFSCNFILSEYSSYFDAIETIVRDGEHKYLGGIKVKEAVKNLYSRNGRAAVKS